jgi:gluconokinase
MGVSGSGKSSLAEALAKRLQGVYLEADDYHPRRNIERMSQGQPLTDDDRWPWLAAVAEAARRTHAGGRPVVIACSALRASYRNFLRERLPGLRIVFLQADEALLRHRLENRSDHFAKAALLPSQFETLEAPTNEPGVLVLGAAESRGRLLDQAAHWLQS